MKSFLRKNLILILAVVATSFFSHSETRASVTCSELFSSPGGEQTGQKTALQSLANMSALENQAAQILSRSRVFQISGSDQSAFVMDLPVARTQNGTALVDDLQGYLNQVSSNELKLDAKPILSRGDARIYFVRNKAEQKEFVLKIFPRSDLGGLIHEISAGSVLSDLAGPNFGFVKIHDAFRVTVDGQTRLAMLVDAAPGEGFKEFLKRHPAELEISQYLHTVALGFSQFHLRSQNNIGEVAARCARAYDFNRMRDDLSRISFEDFAAQFATARPDGARLKAALNDVVTKAERVDFPYAGLVHGDGHPDNVFVDHGRVWFIDFMSAEWSMRRGAAGIEATGDPLSDVGRFLGGAAFDAIKSGTPGPEIDRFEEKFLATYALQWKWDQRQIKNLADFYWLRFAIVRLYDSGGLVSSSEKKLIFDELKRRFLRTEQVTETFSARVSPPFLPPVPAPPAKKSWKTFWK
jgi:hypothetical protein